MPDPELGHRDERKVVVSGVISEPGDRMRSVYDFGDHWQHEIVVEKVLTAELGARYPVCVTGKARCPTSRTRRVPAAGEALDDARKALGHDTAAGSERAQL